MSYPTPQKYFPVSWEELHRNAKALAWKLHDMGAWKGLIAITRGGLVPAAIVARVGLSCRVPGLRRVGCRL